jgi:hypothetical protein
MEYITLKIFIGINDLSAEFDGSFVSGGKHYLLTDGKIFIDSYKVLSQ